MHVLVTRPEADAREMKAQIESIGHRVSVAPLIEIVHEVIEPHSLRGAAALVATSRNAITALASSPAIAMARTLPVFAVGSATASAARRAGFISVIEGPGAARDLAAVVARHPLSKSGPIVHLAGDHLAVDLAPILAAADVVLDVKLAYRSIAAQSLPGAVCQALAASDIDAVILMSPRTAMTWAKLVAGPLQSQVDRVAHLCLSNAVAAALPGSRSQNVHVAHSPSSDGMLSLIRRLASGAPTS